MYLNIFLAALALCSVSAEDLDCTELQQTVDNPGLITEKWIIHAAGFDSEKMLQIVPTPRSSWIEFIAKAEKDKYSVHLENLKDNQCVIIEGEAYMSGNEMKMALSCKLFNSTHSGVFLQTYDDNAVVWYDKRTYQQGSNVVEGNAIALLTKNGIVAEATLERFQNQAKCKNIVKLLNRESTTDLCPLEKTASAK